MASKKTFKSKSKNLNITKNKSHGALSETGSTYRLLISVSKSKGPQKAAEIILDEATTASEFLYDLA